MDKMKQFLRGKKTYGVVLASAITLLVAWAEGNVDNSTAIRDLVGLVIAATLRHGVSAVAAEGE